MKIQPVNINSINKKISAKPLTPKLTPVKDAFATGVFCSFPIVFYGILTAITDKINKEYNSNIIKF